MPDLDPDKRKICNLTTVGELRAALDGLPDYAQIKHWGWDAYGKLDSSNHLDLARLSFIDRGQGHKRKRTFQLRVSSFPFVMECSGCNKGGPDTYDEAIADGWARISSEPDCASYSFLGLCPACAKGENEGANHA